MGALDVEAEVFGKRDRFTEEDASAWDPVAVHAVSAHGPAGLGCVSQLPSAIKAFDPDLLHVQGIWQFQSLVALRWAQRVGAKGRSPHVISPRGMLDSWALAHSRWKKRLVGKLFEDAHLRSAGCIHALNLSEARSIRSFGLSNPIAVIPNGVVVPSGAESEFGPLPDGWPQSRQVVLFIGRLHSKKGLLPLVDGWAASDPLKRRGWHLVIAGWDDGNHVADVQQRIADNGVDAEVTLIGPLYGRSKEATLQAADAFVLPSQSEGLPMAVLEAWSYGLPSLISGACNLPEAFEAHAAIRCEPNTDSVRAALGQLFGMPVGARRAMGTAAGSLVEDDFSLDVVTRRMADVYRWLLLDEAMPECVIPEGVPV